MPTLSSNSKLAIYSSAFGLLVVLSLALSYFSLNNSSLLNDTLALLPQGNLGILTLFICLSLGTSIGLPRQVAAFSAGFMLDIATGTLLATVAAITGCIISLMVARWLLAAQVQKKYPQPLAKVADFFSHDTFTKILIIRILPAGSNLLTNILAGVAKVPLLPYLLGSALGFIPQMIIFSMMGNGIKLADQQQLLISVALFLIAAALSGYLYKKSPKAHQLTLRNK